MRTRSIRLLGTSLVLILVLLILNLRTNSLEGPPSPHGYRVNIIVSDVQMGPGADCYSDVRIFDPTGQVVAEWKDPAGQESLENARAMIRSMQWKGDKRLVFQPRTGPEVTISW